MLVLRRKLGEKLIIGDNIVVQVVSIQKNKVLLGVVAPDDVDVFREEVLKREQNELSEK